ncbi:hypothetical protein P4O66_004379 [Electrophorus voltai]|uniref:Alpha-ketoglutarate-dependent dioxygenase FTO C-terminal domain-containing protein n=1 Tax=Electrophorus voltai TaxID=2609070 RepID=A0AAD9E1V6_9TELE|nr:hypothetical protein P4O66_004379 [Electrophorus voltai]
MVRTPFGQQPEAGAVCVGACLRLAKDAAEQRRVRPLDLSALQHNPLGGAAYLVQPRCQSNLAQTLPPEEAPIDRPYWSGDDPDMPLPFDLSDIISRVESLLWSLFNAVSGHTLPGRHLLEEHYDVLIGCVVNESERQRDVITKAPPPTRPCTSYYP